MKLLVLLLLIAALAVTVATATSLAKIAAARTAANAKKKLIAPRMTNSTMSLVAKRGSIRGVTPECIYTCDNPICHAECIEICQKPACTFHCNEGAPTCISTPYCINHCAVTDFSAVDSCPMCEVLCSQSIRCTECSILCEEPVCNWRCFLPRECPKPNCQLSCEMPACAYE